MSELSNQTNNQLKKPSNTRFLLRTGVFFLLASGYYTFVPEWFKSWLEPAAYAGFIGAWKYVFAPILIFFGLIAVYRTFRRRLPLGYMKNYVAACRDNGYTHCPRCGHDLEERTGKESYRTRVGTKMTTTKWSDGSTTKKEEAIYGTRTREYTYFKCTNHGCGLGTDRNHPWKWQMTLPYKKREIEALCTPGASMPSGMVNPAATLQIRLNGIVVCLLTLIFITVSLLMFDDFCDKNNYSITEPLTGNTATVAKAVLDAENDKTNWTVSIDEFTMDYGTYMTFCAESSATVKRYLQKDGTEVIHYEFDGLDLGTGLEGEFDILTVDGVLHVADYEEEVIYPKGNVVFEQLYPKLSTLTYDVLLEEVTTKAKWDKYGKNTQYKHILQGDGIELGVYDEKRTEIVTEKGQLRTRYVVTTENDEQPTAYYMGDFKIAGKDENLDELGRLLADASNDVYIEYYKDDELLCDITYRRNLKEHEFVVEEPYGDLKRGSYRIADGGETIDAEFWDSDYIHSTKESLKISENQKLYDQLMALVPNTYLRKHIDMKTTDEFNFIGIYTSYTKEDKNGNEIAQIQLIFGGLDKFIHNISDTERLEMAWP